MIINTANSIIEELLHGYVKHCGFLAILLGPNWNQLLIKVEIYSDTLFLEKIDVVHRLVPVDVPMGM